MFLGCWTDYDLPGPKLQLLSLMCIVRDVARWRGTASVLSMGILPAWIQSNSSQHCSEQTCSGNICRNDSLRYAFASSTEPQIRLPSSCRPQCRPTHFPSGPLCTAPKIGPSSVM